MELSFRIKKNAECIFEYLTDMEKFACVHPVIYKIDQTGDERYLVHETLKLGIIPFSFKYPIMIEKNRFDKVVLIRAKVFKLTKIEMKYVLKSDGDYTIIEEKIQFKSLLPITFIMENIFRKQHNQLFKNIEMK